ncbi:MAG: hypothetical protein A2Y38_04610 [Spirochaetes bacterium GWB1_59_5]|nr:MAG: hypothetical protein A2Y38_04610 [Spirochaetes bacterium GWB1_59_5]
MDRYDEKMVALAMSFPSLAARSAEWGPGWDSIRFQEWKDRVRLGSGATAAAQFVWIVWYGGGFDMFHAMRLWDDKHLAAFQAYVAAPFFP